MMQAHADDAHADDAHADDAHADADDAALGTCRRFGERRLQHAWKPHQREREADECKRENKTE
jgi:hypothetical protein